MAVIFDNELKKAFDALKSCYPDNHSALLPTLDLAQRQFGWLSKEVMDYVAELLDLPALNVYETATFYTMFNKKAVGRYHIQVCTNISCMLNDAEELLAHFEKKLGIKAGQTSSDGLFTLSEVECLGCCGAAPTVQINDDYYENMTNSKADELITRFKKEASENK